MKGMMGGNDVYEYAFELVPYAPEHVSFDYDREQGWTAGGWKRVWADVQNPAGMLIVYRRERKPTS